MDGGMGRMDGGMDGGMNRMAASGRTVGAASCRLFLADDRQGFPIDIGGGSSSTRLSVVMLPLCESIARGCPSIDGAADCGIISSEERTVWVGPSIVFAAPLLVNRGVIGRAIREGDRGRVSATSAPAMVLVDSLVDGMVRCGSDRLEYRCCCSVFSRAISSSRDSSSATRCSNSCSLWSCSCCFILR